jgi:hypothetical protein
MSGIYISDPAADFITPSDACINPIHLNKSNAAPSPAPVKPTTVVIELEDSIEPEPILQPASITLADCLACSGCVTSAETVLISLQSVGQITRVLTENKFVSNNKLTRKLPESEKKTVIISVSPQSRASLAVRYKLSPTVVHRKLTYFFKSIGVSHTLDTAFSRDISLLESAREFVDRYKEKRGPMLSSACPGWICYVRNKHADLIIGGKDTSELDFLYFDHEITSASHGCDCQIIHSEEDGCRENIPCQCDALF